MKQIIKIVQMAATERAAFMPFEPPEVLLDRFAVFSRHSKFSFSLATRTVVETRTTRNKIEQGKEKEQFKYNDLLRLTTV